MGKRRTDAHPGEGADVTRANGSVRIEILARGDCPNRGMAITVVERLIDEMGVPAEIKVIDVSSPAQAAKRRLFGSPTVRVDGHDVDPGPNPHDEWTTDDRVYRTERGLIGWPEPQWVRDAVLRALAETTSNGSH
jgi:hypothetical protein